ncbi:Fic family protein [Cellulomonas sp. NTE-D12]|uniref:type II toxin-antitoxin system death-on-curing family toxin n=1 Tax=Cellulomonas sp. NTE-D12 TaxID=2962632 RepID=UPI003081CFA7|nr:toxin Doc [Cellulomonas sp. NTE-D12]
MTGGPVEYPELADAQDICDQLGLHIRDAGALASAVARPAVVVWGEEAYPSIHLKAAALLDGINCSHPLLDGNKRLSILLVMLLYQLNGLNLHVDPAEGDCFIRDVAGGRRLELDKTAAWLADRCHSRDVR